MRRAKFVNILVDRRELSFACIPYQPGHHVSYGFWRSQKRIGSTQNSREPLSQAARNSHPWDRCPLIDIAKAVVFLSSFFSVSPPPRYISIVAVPLLKGVGLGAHGFIVSLAPIDCSAVASYLGWPLPPRVVCSRTSCVLYPRIVCGYIVC